MLDIRKHEIFDDLNIQLDRLDRASPAGKLLGQIVQALLAGRFEYGELWEDLRFPATSINPPGLASDPTWDSVNGGWLFNSSSTELLYTIAQIPHAWKAGSILHPHVHWEKSTSAVGDVFWQLRYEWCKIGNVRETLITLNSTTPYVSDNDTADSHAITELGEISGVGKDISDILVMRIERIGADSADTYGADVRLLEFDIHYQIDAIGSDEEYEKSELE